MKLPFATMLFALSAASAAFAQGNPSGALKPKPVPTTSVRPDGTTAARPKLQTPDETAKAMAQAERLSIQSDLAWTSDYNGIVNGEVSERMVAAIKAFQKRHGGKDTGVLNPLERSTLSDSARKLQGNVGWKITTDMVTGARIGLPLKLVPNASSDANGSKWSSPTGTIVISLDRRKQAGATTASVADTERKASARRIEYAAVKPDFFVFSGLQGLKRFYVRGQTLNNEVRVLTILYDQAMEGTMTPITVVMSSSFNPFPTSSTQASEPQRRKIEYSTGIVVSADGDILADRQAIDGCDTIVAANYGNVEKGAQDDTNDLALVRLYGANGLRPLPVGGSDATSSGTITGIADPQMQGGDGAITSIAVTLNVGGPDKVLSPIPPLGFSGAPVMDTTGKFAALARVRPTVVAGPATAANIGTFVPASAVRDFLAANKIQMANGTSGTRASVVRLICVRK